MCEHVSETQTPDADRLPAIQSHWQRSRSPVIPSVFCVPSTSDGLGRDAWDATRGLSRRCETPLGAFLCNGSHRSATGVGIEGGKGVGIVRRGAGRGVGVAHS